MKRSELFSHWDFWLENLQILFSVWILLKSIKTQRYKGFATCSPKLLYWRTLSLSDFLSTWLVWFGFPLNSDSFHFMKVVFCNQGVFPQWILKYEGLFLSCRCFSPFAGVTVIHFAVTFMTAALNNAIGNLCDDKQHTLAATLHYSSACSFKSYSSIRFRTVNDLQIRPQLYFLSK